MTTNGHAPASLVTLLAARGVRLTRPRRAVLNVVAGERHPLAVAEIHARLRGHDVNIGSVYRTIALLCRLDIMQLPVLARLERRVRRATRFQVTGHDLRLYGLCAACATA